MGGGHDGRSDQGARDAHGDDLKQASAILNFDLLRVRSPQKNKDELEISAKDVGNSGKPKVRDGDGGGGRCGQV